MDDSGGEVVESPAVHAGRDELFGDLVVWESGPLEESAGLVGECGEFAVVGRR